MSLEPLDPRSPRAYNRGQNSRHSAIFKITFSVIELPIPCSTLMGEYLYDMTHKTLLSLEMRSIELGGGGLG